eukprot:TRINITY_DN7918_c0_g2_i1.p2 TRINITY_DN7918_c0_g2~~TRINITY_DN7918_c0_g2_i1.p2  ORF type:complete len:113 (+),score=4.88 TRINITY_DN7918_c0_g2_i1:350-688(+)
MMLLAQHLLADKMMEAAVALESYRKRLEDNFPSALGSVGKSLQEASYSHYGGALVELMIEDCSFATLLDVGTSDSVLDMETDMVLAPNLLISPIFLQLFPQSFYLALYQPVV